VEASVVIAGKREARIRGIGGEREQILAALHRQLAKIGRADATLEIDEPAPRVPAAVVEDHHHGVKRVIPRRADLRAAELAIEAHVLVRCRRGRVGELPDPHVGGGIDVGRARGE